MIETSNEYLSSVENHIRDIITRIYFNGSETPLVEELITATVNEIGQSTDLLIIGDLCTNMATVKFTMPSTPIALENGYFRLEHGVLVNGEYEYVNMGTYYISEIETVEGSNQYTVKGYDRSTRLNVDYVPSVSAPCTVEDIVKDICTQRNIVLDSTYVFPRISIPNIYEGTCKDTIKYMAGLMGMNAKIDRNDNLTFYWYGKAYLSLATTSALNFAVLDDMELDTEADTYIINRDIQYMRGFVKTTEEDITINSLTSGSTDNVLVSGSGRGLMFDNPYMTQEILDALMQQVKGFTYTPATISYRGNPALEIGDVVAVEDRDGSVKYCLVSEHELTLTGMKGTITSKGKTEVETVFSNESPSEIKLKKMYNTMLNAFQNSTDLIVGAKGGYFVIDYDDGGRPTSWKIMDTPTLTDNTKLWIFNKNGLGYSTNGGKTLRNVAIDMEGNINANVITTGALQGDKFELNLDDGTLVIGEREEGSGEFNSKWLSVSKDNLEIQKGYVGGIEIKDGDLVTRLECDNEDGYWSDGATACGYAITDFGDIELYREYGKTEVDEDEYDGTGRTSLFLDGYGIVSTNKFGNKEGNINTLIEPANIFLTYESEFDEETGYDENYVYKGASIGLEWENFDNLIISSMGDITLDGTISIYNLDYDRIHLINLSESNNIYIGEGRHTGNVGFYGKNLYWRNQTGATTYLTINSGDTWTAKQHTSGYITSDRKVLYFYIDCGKHISNDVSTCTIKSLKLNIRIGEGGYVGEGYVSGGYEYVGKSAYTITPYVRNDSNGITIKMEQNQTYATTNNSPVSVDVQEIKVVFA